VAPCAAAFATPAGDCGDVGSSRIGDSMRTTEAAASMVSAAATALATAII
jgi:hypothetical protein